MTVADHGITPDQVGGTVTQAQIDQAVHTISTLCGWQPWPVRRETLTVRAPGDPEVFLPTTRLTEVHSITIDGRTIDVEDIEWWEDGILEVTPPVFYRALLKIVVIIKRIKRVVKDGSIKQVL